MRISDWSSDVCSSDLGADVQGHVAADDGGDGDGQPVSTDRALVAGDGRSHHRQEDNGEPEGNDDPAKAEGQRLPIAETLKIADVPVLAIFLRRCQATRP